MERSSLRHRISRGLSEPHLVFREMNRWYFQYVERAQPEGVDFFDEDWDNLFFLDACRYDTFAEQHTLPGTLEARHSRASSTYELLATYFDDADLRDTVYVTANPQLHRRRENIDVSFHDVVEVWKDDGWDDAYKTVRPATVERAAENAAERYPNKRLVVHFIQPHYPYIGPTGQEHFDLDSLDFFNRVHTGEVDIDDRTLRQAYRENLDIVLQSVERLLGSLSGKTVVTSDHGEMLGERAYPLPFREYGHPTGIYTEELTKVPWLEYHSGERKTVTESEAVTRDETDADAAVVEERLADLGYR